MLKATLSPVKTKLARLADALGALKLSKDAITEEYENARVLAIATGEKEFSGSHWKATITDVESARLNMEKLEKFIQKHGRTIDSFKDVSSSPRLLLKPL